MKQKHKIFYDTEFVEGFTQPLFGKPEHFIDLISIGMVREDGKEYYPVNKEVNLKRAWNAHNLKPNKQIPFGPIDIEEYWVRENVLSTIFYSFYKPSLSNLHYDPSFTLPNMQKVINAIGKTTKEIQLDIRSFMYGLALHSKDLSSSDAQVNWWLRDNEFELVGHFAAYDHVLLASLFGRMVDWPAGFPMYTTDLQQKIANLENLAATRQLHVGPAKQGSVLMCEHRDTVRAPKQPRPTERVFSVAALAGGTHPETMLPGAMISYKMGTVIPEWGNTPIARHPNYPAETNTHHALDDAKWIKQLDRFLATY